MRGAVAHPATNCGCKEDTGREIDNDLSADDGGVVFDAEDAEDCRHEKRVSGETDDGLADAGAGGVAVDVVEDDVFGEVAVIECVAGDLRVEGGEVPAKSKARDER